MRNKGLFEGESVDVNKDTSRISPSIFNMIVRVTFYNFIGTSDRMLGSDNDNPRERVNKVVRIRGILELDSDSLLIMMDS
jgi:hypothetical protein